MDLLGIFDQLDPATLTQLKRSDEWRWFVELYHGLLSDLIDDEEDRVVDAIVDIATVEKASFPRGLGHDEFFEISRRTACVPDSHGETKLSSALDVLRAAHHIFDAALFDSVRSRAADIAVAKGAQRQLGEINEGVAWQT